MSFLDYVIAQKIALADEFFPKSKIYLDINFWIRIRDAAKDPQRDKYATKLLELLQYHVNAGNLVCPISCSSLIEFFKQPAKLRKETAKVVDILSQGLAFVPVDELQRLEVSYFIHQAITNKNYISVNRLVWTRPIYVFGFSYFDIPVTDAKVKETIQKNAFEDVWNLRFSDLLSVDRPERDLHDHDALAAYINENNKKFASTKSSWIDIYEQEILGAIDILFEDAKEAFLSAIRMRYNDSYAENTDLSPKTEQQLKAFLVAGMKKGTLSETLKSLHVRTSFYTQMRFDQMRRYKPNHMYDFEHAVYALSYCEYFFTEKEIRSLSEQLSLGCVNGCKVVSKIQEAIDIMESFR